jgi:hypothetical protein
MVANGPFGANEDVAILQCFTLVSLRTYFASESREMVHSTIELRYYSKHVGVYFVGNHIAREFR